MQHFDRSITVTINITAQQADLTIPQYVTLSNLCITNATVWASGTSSNGKTRANQTVINDCRISVQTKGNQKIQDLPLAYLLPNTNGLPASFILDKADIQEAVITINTSETITDQVIEITFFYIDEH